MKVFFTKIFSLLMLSFISVSGIGQYVTIPDANFRGALQQQFPACFNGSGQMDTTCSAIVNLTGLSVAYKNISDLDGIQYFDALQQFVCSHNQLSSLPVLPSTLMQLDCGYNLFTTLPVLPPNIFNLNMEYNALTSLSALPPALNTLNLNSNQLSALTTLPSGLVILRCSNNQLTALPALPGNLAHLVCDNNQLTGFPTLPNSLYYLIFYNNQVPSSGLPAVLPASLNNFDASLNPLTVFPDFSNCPGISSVAVTGSQIPAIPPLPPTLTDFRCNANYLITSIPPIPSGLRILDVSSCSLTTLPALPNGLQALNCAYNPLGSLPAVLPDSLQSLACDSTYITTIPTLPYGMYFLSCTWNSGLTCLPLLPPHLESLSCFNTPINCLPNYPPSLFSISPANLTVCNASSSCALYPEINGKVFSDNNNNGVQDPGEAPLANRIISIQPDDWYAISDANGEYSLRVEPNISYTQTSSAITYYTISPASYNVSFSAMAQVDSLNDFAYYPAPNMNDLRITLTSGIARPGFDMNYWITFKNIGTTTQNGTVSLTFDNAILTYLNSSLAPSAQTGNALSWTFPNLAPFAEGSIIISFNVGATVSLGSILNATAEIQPVTGDVTPSDNVDTDSRTVQGSYDPNEKHVSETILTPAEVASGKMLEYTIFFQNTGTDTAFTVKLIDTLSLNLNIASLEVLSASHPYSLMISEHGTLHVHYANILLPDSNTNEPASHGFIKYRILPKNTLVLGDEIHNKTDIYFDYNLPITTNTVTTTVSLTESIEPEWASGFKFYPNPAKDRIICEFASPDFEDASFTLLSPAGQVVVKNLTPERLSSTKSGLILKGIPAGCYFLQIQTRNGVITRKLMVM